MAIAPETTIEEGSISVIGNTGQVAIGNNIVQEINHNCIINKITPGEEPIWERGGKLEVKPRKPKNFLNRTSEIQQLETEIKDENPIIISGPDGIGKSTLIEYLSHLVQVEKFPDGLYHLSALNLKFEDLLQNLFSAFFESNIPAIPNRAQIQNKLREIKALILIDDVMLSKNEMKVILNIAPRCVFLLVSSQLESQNWIDILALEGLPESEAQPLFEEAFDRTFDSDEKELSFEICRLLKGHPETILRLAARVREERTPLSDVVSTLKTEPPESIIQESIQTLSEDEKQILFVLAAADGRILPQEHVYSLLPSDVDEVKLALAHLLDRSLIQSHSPAYSLTIPMTELVVKSFALYQSEEALISYFVDWVVEQTFDQITDEMLDTLLAVTKKAAKRKKWSAVIKIGRVIESILFLRGKWKAWEDILHLILEAAKGLGDRKTEAWALHQLGSRLFCLDFKYQAKKLLKQAASIRQNIGDLVGLEVTHHNLSLLPKVVLPKIRINPPGSLPNILSLWIGIGSIAVLGVATVLGMVFYTPKSPPLTQPPQDYLEERTRKPQFEWQTVFWGNSYQIQIDDQEDFSSPEFDRMGSTIISTPDMMLEQGIYYWRVRGINRFDRVGDWSETWQFIVSIPPPVPPLSLPEDRTIITGIAKPDLSWESVENGSNYQVQVDDRDDFSSPEFDATTPNTSSTVEPALILGDYYWRVRAINEYDTPGEWSSIWEFSINIPPDVPELSTPVDEDLVETTTRPEMEWKSVEYAVSYQIQIDDNSNFSSPEFDASSSTTSTTVTNSLEQGVYYWRARAVNIYDTPSQWSPTWEMMISIPPGIPVLISPETDELIETTTTPSFEWEGVQNGDTYQLQVDDNRNFNALEYDSHMAETINSIETELTLGDYYWRVRALNQYGTPGKWSSARKFSINYAPEVPELIRPVDDEIIETTTTLTLEWGSVEFGDSYQVHVDNNSNFSSPEFDSSGSTTNRNVSDSLEQGFYYWRVRAINKYDTPSEWSERWKFTVSIPPDKPVLLKPSDGVLIENTPRPVLAWGNVENGATYQVEVDNNSSFSSPEYDTNAWGTSRASSSLEQGKYYWRVRALNQYGTPSEWSTVWEFSVSIPPGIPILEEPAYGEKLETTTKPTLSWSGESNAEKFQWELDNNSNFSSPEYEDTISGTSDNILSSLDQGIYYWRVRAINEYDTPGRWGASRFTISIPPDAPSLLDPDNGSTVESTTPTFRWTSVENVDYYRIEVDNNSNFSSIDYYYVTYVTSQTEHKVLGGYLQQGEYYWRVRAFNDYGTPGEWSSTREFIASPPPAAPALLNPSNNDIVVDDTTPTFYWNSVSNAVRYQLQVDNNSSFSSPAYNNDNITSTSRQINVSLSQGVYYWRVRAINTYETEGAWSSVWQFTISIAPGAPQLNSPSYGSYIVNDNPMYFDWDPVNGANKYRIQISDADNPNYFIREFETYYSSILLNRTDMSIDCGTHNYHWFVFAINSYGTRGPWSDIWYFRYNLTCVE
jgi:predicted phage tail protein